nr:immunoglobulin heavy chain junction region [Mus musculus]
CTLIYYDYDGGNFDVW